MKNIKSKIIALLISSLIFNDAHACNDLQKSKLRLHEKQAIELINSWLYTLENKYQVDLNSLSNQSQSKDSNGVTQSPIEMATGILLCSKKFLNRGFNYKCTDLDHFTARTLPIFGRGIEISDKHFWRAREIQKIGVVIHEATHKCGTNDATYFKNNERPRNHRFFGWATIASTYETWAESGLCIPDQDCE